jgi:hypothetical protein
MQKVARPEFQRMAVVLEGDEPLDALHRDFAGRAVR